MCLIASILEKIDPLHLAQIEYVQIVQHLFVIQTLLSSILYWYVLIFVIECDFIQN